MPGFRLALAHALILFVIGGSAYDIVTRQEHWPFSNYPMFSTVHRRPVLTWLRLFGVTVDNQERPLLRYNELYPLDQSRLPLGLRQLASLPDGDVRVQSAISDVLHRYNERRAQGEIKGPELRSIRLYRMQWEVQPFARNLDRPMSRQQLAEASVTSR